VTGTEKGSGGADSFRFNPKEVSDSIRNVVQDKVDAYIPSSLLHGLREGLKAIGFEIKGKATTTTTSSAWSRDLQEAMHTEDNAFLSYVSVTTQLHDATPPVAERVSQPGDMSLFLRTILPCQFVRAIFSSSIQRFPMAARRSLRTTTMRT
jgi:hypothetical protein